MAVFEQRCTNLPSWKGKWLDIFIYLRFL